MKVKIVSRWDSSKVILCGEYESIKDCLEKNRGYLKDADLGGANLVDANLGGADLGGANLVGAYLRGANLRDAYLRGANLRDANLGGADLGGANLVGAYLRGASLRDAYLRGANLRDANLGGANLGDADLGGANLRGAKNYYNSHDFAMEIIRRQPIEYFTAKEWSFIGQCTIHRFCYDTIKKDYTKVALSVFKKLTKLGYGEYEEKLK